MRTGTSNRSRVLPARSNSQLLRARMELTCGRLDAAYDRLWTHRGVGELVPGFLILMHQIVRASVPLMAAAREVASARSREDTVCGLLATYLAEHIAEERDHDEWLLQDLETAGIGRHHVMSKTPSSSVAALVGAQYYWIHHHDPVALLGYIRVLEGSPPSAAHVDFLQKTSRLPPSVFRTYALHGELDPHHLGELDRFIDSLPLRVSQGHLMWASASHTAEVLATCLEQLEFDGAVGRLPASEPSVKGSLHNG